MYKGAKLLKSTSAQDFCSTGPYTNFWPQNQEIDEFYIVQERRVTYFEAPRLRKGRSEDS